MDGDNTIIDSSNKTRTNNKNPNYRYYENIKNYNSSNCFLPPSHECKNAFYFTVEHMNKKKSWKRHENDSSWYMESLDNEFCFLSNSFSDQRIACNQHGALFLSNHHASVHSEQVFRFVRTTRKGHSSSYSKQHQDDFWIISWAPNTTKRDSFFLSSDSKGNVFTTTNNNKTIGDSERWRIRLCTNNPKTCYNSNYGDHHDLDDTCTEPLWFIESVAHGRLLTLRPNTFFLEDENENDRLQTTVYSQEPTTTTTTTTIPTTTTTQTIDHQHQDLDPSFNSSSSSFHQPIIHHPSYSQPYASKTTTSTTTSKFLYTVATGRTNEDEHSSCQWHLEAAHKHIYFISSLSQGVRIGSNFMGRPWLTYNWTWDAEWQVQLVGGDSCSSPSTGRWGQRLKDSSFITFYSLAFGAYLASTSDGRIVMSPYQTESSIWELEYAPRKGSNYHAANGAVTVFLVSLAYHRYLTCDAATGTLSTVPNIDGKNEIWQLNPRLPSSKATTANWIIGLLSTPPPMTSIVGFILLLSILPVFVLGASSSSFSSVSGTSIVGIFLDQTLNFFFSSRFIAVEPMVISSQLNQHDVLVSLLEYGDI